MHAPHHHSPHQPHSLAVNTTRILVVTLHHLHSQWPAATLETCPAAKGHLSSRHTQLPPAAPPTSVGGKAPLPPLQQGLPGKVWSHACTSRMGTLPVWVCATSGWRQIRLQSRKGVHGTIFGRQVVHHNIHYEALPTSGHHCIHTQHHGSPAYDLCPEHHHTGRVGSDQGSHCIAFVT